MHRGIKKISKDIFDGIEEDSLVCLDGTEIFLTKDLITKLENEFYRIDVNDMFANFVEYCAKHKKFFKNKKEGINEFFQFINNNK